MGGSTLKGKNLLPEGGSEFVPLRVDLYYGYLPLMHTFSVLCVIGTTPEFTVCVNCPLCSDQAVWN